MGARKEEGEKEEVEMSKRLKKPTNQVICTIVILQPPHPQSFSKAGPHTWPWENSECEGESEEVCEYVKVCVCVWICEWVCVCVSEAEFHTWITLKT